MATSDVKELKAQWKTEIEVPTISAKDVAKHNTKGDTWMTIHGKVYDVTSYLRDHPGGPEALLEVAGQDATSAYEDVGHSEDAREIMHPFLVGVLENAQQAPAAAKQQPQVQVVKRGPNGRSSREKASVVYAELAIGGVLASTLAWSLWQVVHHLHLPEHGKSLHSRGGFVSGFALASTMTVAAAIVAYRYLGDAITKSFGGAYTKHPPHLHIQNSSVVHSSNRPAGVLIPQEYQAWPLVRKDQLSVDAYRFVFQLPTQASVLGLPIGQHVAIRGYFDDPEGHHTVTRSYTPVSNNKDLGRLELVIKLYPDGQLTGKYLSNLKLGDKVEFRGPKGAMRYRKGMSSHIGMIAGGTGITPMYQIIRAICEDKTDDTIVSLIYASKSPADILLQQQLDRLQQMAPKKLTITYMIDKAVPGWTGGVGYVDKKLMADKLAPPSKNTKVMLCGPPGMVKASKKNLVELGFEAPGAVSKMTDQIFLF